MKAAGPGRDLMALAVKDIMSPDPVMLREEDSLAVALQFCNLCSGTRANGSYI